MKKTLVLAISMFALIAMSSPAFAVMIGSVDVGDVDNLKAFATLADSGYDTELNWIQSELGSSYSFDKYDYTPTELSGVVSGADPGTDIHAYELQDATSYYFLKLGVGNTGSPTHYLFENVDDLMYAVFDFSEIVAATGGNLNMNWGRISHTGEIGSQPIPEPTTILLLGLGLAGLAGFRRNKILK